MFGVGPFEMVVIGCIAVLLFGKKLPEVAKNVGKTYQEFRKGIGDIQSNFKDVDMSGSYADSNAAPSSPSYDDFDDREEATAPKFEPPPSAPTADDA
jgi:sec-independent protein translocase protein TatA